MENSLPRDIHHREYIVLDTETTGLHWWEDKVVGIAWALPDGTCGYVRTDSPEVRDWASRELPRAKRLIFHNAKFDLHFLREYGVDLSDRPLHDTMVAAALLDENLREYGLDFLGKLYCGVGKDGSIYAELAELFGGKPTRAAQGQNLHRAPFGLLHKYACQDVAATRALYIYQRSKLAEEELERVMSLEMDLLPALVRMEFGGVRVDVPRAEQAVDELTEVINRRQRKLEDLAGKPVNVNSSPQMRQLFRVTQTVSGAWETSDGTVLDTTDGGQPSINKEALERMLDPMAKLVLGIRQATKTRDTFLLGHILGHHKGGVIHANFNQTRSDNALGTGSGRLSCNDPALQQIHKRNKEVASIVRAIFLPDPEQLWSCRDWDQMDFRIFAHYANNPRILRAYHDNPDMDYHQMIADLTGLPRTATPGIKGNAKQVNLGLAFGMGEGRLAREMGLPHEVVNKHGKKCLVPGPEAIYFFEKYHELVPGIRELLSRASSIARSRGYVKTIFGRRIRFPKGWAVYSAGALVFQGSAADALKTKIVEVDRILRGTGGRLLLNVHDELGSSLPLGAEGERLNREIGEAMQCFDGVNCPIKFNVPIRSSSGSGANWWEASK